ncbi:MAG TPA: hypothetical protein VLA88_04385 [Candidatus Saccharimonadales bacterium]|nr:hypothetical protein [Candidatus Saccharimonadales bacterium]
MRLGREGMRVNRIYNDHNAFTATVTWGPLEFLFIDPTTTARIISIFPGLFLSDIAVEVAYPELSPDEVKRLSDLDRLIYVRWQLYLPMHLERLLIEEEALRAVPEGC